MKTNIALTGFMATGKTVTGRLLAKKLGKQFVETDSLIEEKAGKSIPDIFRLDGEIAFREMEIEVTKQISAEKNMVIACGGGIVLNKINIDRLKQGCIIIYLTASTDAILERVKGEPGTRPLLEVEDPSGTIEELLQFRKPLYERAADITIDTSNLDTESITSHIMDNLRKNESFNL